MIIIIIMIMIIIQNAMGNKENLTWDGWFVDMIGEREIKRNGWIVLKWWGEGWYPSPNYPLEMLQCSSKSWHWVYKWGVMKIKKCACFLNLND